MSRNPWPYGIVLFFVLFFGGIAAVIVIASRQNDTLVSENYYEQELKFQDQINAAARAKNAGADLQFDVATRTLIVRIPAGQVTATNLSGKIQVLRASSPDLDKELAFAPGAQGEQRVDLSGFAAGSWRVRASWHAAGEDYYLEQKINLPAK